MCFVKTNNSLHFNVSYLAHFLKYLDKLPLHPGPQSEDVDGGEGGVAVGRVVGDVLTDPDGDGPNCHQVSPLLITGHQIDNVGQMFDKFLQ